MRGEKREQTGFHSHHKERDERREERENSPSPFFSMREKRGVKREGKQTSLTSETGQ